jgi:hypothetical protein
MDQGWICCYIYHSLADRFFMQERTRKHQIPSAFTQVYAEAGTPPVHQMDLKKKTIRWTWKACMWNTCFVCKYRVKGHFGENVKNPQLKSKGSGYGFYYSESRFLKPGFFNPYYRIPLDSDGTLVLVLCRAHVRIERA